MRLRRLKTYYGIERARGSSQYMNGTVYQKVERDDKVMAVRKYDGITWNDAMRFEGSSMGGLLVGKSFSEITYSGKGTMIRVTDTEDNRILCAPPIVEWAAPKQFNLRWMSRPVMEELQELFFGVPLYE